MLSRLVPFVVCVVPALALGGPALAAGSKTSVAPSPLTWDVGLRGQYTVDSTGGHYETILAPDANIDMSQFGGDSAVSASAQVHYDDTGSFGIDSADLSAKGSGNLDPDTVLSQSLDLNLVQLKATDPSLPPNTVAGPLEFTGTLDGSATHRFWDFDGTADLGLKRFVEGPTTLIGGTTIDDTSKSYWQASGGLRAGYEFVPNASVFVEGDVAYQKYDAVDPTLLVYLDGATTSLRAGLSYDDKGTISAEASTGPAWRVYTDGSVADRMGWLYDGSFSFTPDDHLTLGAGLTTTLVPSDLTPGDTDILTDINANASIAMGAGLKLRGTADWNQETAIGSHASSNGYSYGAGLDFVPAPGTTWSADYLFTHSFTPPGPAQDSQAVTLGVKISG